MTDLQAAGSSADPDHRVPTPYDPSTAMRWLLATLSFAAGAIHLVMVPQHAQESLRVGLAFAAAGWFQMAFGAVMLARPRRLWVVLAVGANLVFVAVWVLSRTAGLPPWTGDGGVEAASSVDVLCVVFEAVTVIAAVALLSSPGILRNWKRHVLIIAAIVPIGILVATTAVLAAPSTAEHAHSEGEHTEAAASEDGHTHEGSEAAVNAAATATASTVHSHETPTDAAASATSEHSHETTETTGAETTGTGTETTSSEPAGHAHADSTITYDELPAQTKLEVDLVIGLWAAKYPTGADATADGWMRATRSLYGIGAHYVRRSGLVVPTAESFDIKEPNILLFDGEGPDAKFAGVSYVTKGIPAGFTGEYDTWHGHTSVCLADGGVVSLIEEDSPVWLSESDCAARGGNVLPLAGADQMMHLWIGPGYIDSGPIMSHDHPLLLDGYNPQQDV